MSNDDRQRELAEHMRASERILDEFALEDGQVPPPPVVPMPRSSGNGSITNPHTDAMHAMRRYVTTGAPPESDVLQIGSEILGGFLAPPELAGPIEARLRASSVMLGLVAGASTTKDYYIRPRVIPASGDDGSIYSSAFIGDFVAEIPVAGAGAAEPTFGQVVVPIRNLRAKCTLSRNLAADAEWDVMSFLVEDGGGNLGQVIDKGLIIGTGVGAQPLGIFPNGDFGTTDIEGPTANTISNSTSDAGSADKIQTLLGSLPAQYHKGASLLMNPTTLTSLRKLVSPAGDYLLPWSSGNPLTLFDYPIVLSPHVAVEADGASVIAFGSFEAAYLAVMRQGIAIQVDLTSKADIEQIVLYVRMRLGGAALNTDALRIGVIPVT